MTSRGGTCFGLGSHLAAPVRVASDGDNAGSGGASTASPRSGDQSVADSAATAQVGGLGTGAPVRVLSDGDNGGSNGGSATSGDQAVEGSTGTVQTGPVALDAPVRVASSKDNDSPPNPVTSAEETPDRGVPGADSGPTPASASDPTPGDTTPATTPETVGTPVGSPTGSPSGSPSAPGVARTMTALNGGAAEGSGGFLRTAADGTPGASVPGHSLGRLAYTGFEAWLLALLGVVCLASGLVIRKRLLRSGVALA